MTILLTDMEARVIGVLLEKSVTTPEQYPLSLNALTNGCNQKSNRYPLTQCSEDEITHVIEGLKAKRIVQTTSGYGSRVNKYSHRFCNTEFGDIKLSVHQQAIITELLLRGPQTPGELRGRCQRLVKFTDMGEVEATINSLLAYQPSPLISALEKEPGKRETRYTHRFTHAIDQDAEDQTNSDVLAPIAAPTDTVASLKAELVQLKSRVHSLETRIKALAPDHE